MQLLKEPYYHMVTGREVMFSDFPDFRFFVSPFITTLEPPIVWHGPFHVTEVSTGCNVTPSHSKEMSISKTVENTERFLIGKGVEALKLEIAKYIIG